MNEKKEKKLNGKSVRFLAAAALSAVLIGSQAPAVYVSGSSEKSAYDIEMKDLFPDNITVSDLVTLAEVTLPENEYGRLEWLDDSIELTERVQSCEVLFVPEEEIDLTDMEGWDEELGGIVGEIHVIVSSMAQDDIEGSLEESWEEPGNEESDSDSEEIEDEAADIEDLETDAELEETGSGDSLDGQEEDTEKADAPTEDNTDKTDRTEEGSLESMEEESGNETEGDAENNGDDSEDTENTEDTEDTENTEHTEEDSMDKEGVLEEDKTEDSESEEDGEENKEDDHENGGNDNIFDDPADLEEEDDRPEKLPENPTEEEKIQQSVINHSCQGISVSGINLPWYVQFRVTSAENFEFTNESDAAIFQSYEFELWDLQNNTEYEIPDGEYISVTVPVKEGYDYTIEHLLDNGASETIIPSVEGSTMIFSTHSFSPFGIAGSKQLVGPDFPIDDEVKPSVTPTPSITQKPGSSGTAGNNGGGNESGTNGGNAQEPSADNKGTGGSAEGNTSGTGGAEGISGSDGSNLGDGSIEGSHDKNGGNINGQNNGQSSNNNHAVDTGDTTAILPFAILVIAAGILIAAVVFLKKKK